MRARIAALLMLCFVSLPSALAQEDLVWPSDTDMRVEVTQFPETTLSQAGDPTLISLSPNGTQVAIKHENAIYLYDVSKTEASPSLLVEHPAEIWGQFSENWSLAMIRDNDINQIDVIDIKTGDVVREFQSSPYTPFRLSPDGRWMATIYGGVMLVLSVETGEAMFQNEYRYAPHTLVFSADSRQIAFIYPEIDMQDPEMNPLNIWDVVDTADWGWPPGTAGIYPPYLSYDFTDGIQSTNVSVGDDFWVMRKEYSVWRLWDVNNKILALELPILYEYEAFRSNEEVLLYHRALHQFGLLNLQTHAITLLISSEQPAQLVWNSTGSAFAMIDQANVLRVVTIKPQ